ncbi:M56 family metallopeptidase [Phenylobacterium sp.]|uniref:M56 family metallopeptidase n=1 Tax=Phenylobacterium sp. TaxID=1871053 RepID=UPI002DF6F18A|nr:M56 family metallopeptidase [Phenylobacterium sp.]
MTELIDAFLRANLVASLAILAVMVLRIPARQRFGPELAYRLWAAPPFAAIGTLVPLRTGAPSLSPLAHLTPAELAPALLQAWGLGLVAAVGLMAWAQLAFLREARIGRAGPAVVGVVTPRLLMPPDDGRYTQAERVLIRAHEREHIARKDPRAGALMAAFQCLAWFNPLVHWAVHLARLDQELACDAAVIRRLPGSRALYAKTLLKTQLAGAALPLGCYWPSRSRHPLEVRVELLRRPVCDESLYGPLLIATGIVTAAVLAWSVEPPLPSSPPRGVMATEPYTTGHMSVMLVTWRVAPARH